MAIPADSIKLGSCGRGHQGGGAELGQISGAIDTAITDGRDGGGQVTPSGTGIRFNFRPIRISPARQITSAYPDRWNGMFGRDRTAGEGGANNMLATGRTRR